jgi:hypothetical protein
MAIETNPALRAELEAALKALEPQIRGGEDFVIDATTPELKTIATEELARLKNRRALLQNAIAADDNYKAQLAALEADNYPDTPKTSVPGPVFDEIKSETSDYKAFVDRFEAVPVATGGKISAPGSPQPKPPGT